MSTASNAVPATSAELDETVRLIQAYGRRGEAIRADIRDIAALRRVADRVDQTYQSTSWWPTRRSGAGCR